jgi:hypothetical protein
MNTMTKIIDNTVFIKHKKQQQRAMWYDGKLSDREFVDWLLVNGDDEDVEWLSQTLDPDFDFMDPANDN